MDAIGPMDPIEAEMQLREWARENVIERMLLRSDEFADPVPVPADAVDIAMEAIKAQIAANPTDGAAAHSEEEIRAQVEAEYRLERLLSRVQGEVKQPKAKEIAEYYKQNKQNFVFPELLRAAHVVKNVDEQHDEESAKAGIEAALAELEAGAPFPEVANRYSDCAGNGGMLDWFPRGEMVEEFEAVVFDLPVGARSGIFRTRFGFHIATVLERRPAGPRPFKDIEGELTDALMHQKRTKAVEDFIDGLRAKADIRQGRSQE
jgi:parvulin-like peptidyl-prolyl isomerase